MIIPEGLSDQEELAYAFAHQRELLEAAIDELAGEID